MPVSCSSFTYGILQRVQSSWITSARSFPEPNAPESSWRKCYIRVINDNQLWEVLQPSQRYLLYLPIYPRVNGRTLSVQGDKLVTSPAPKMTAKLQGRGQGQSENGRTWNVELFIQQKWKERERKMNLEKLRADNWSWTASLACCPAEYSKPPSQSPIPRSAKRKPDGPCWWKAVN
jgi:hypothetical protein